MVATGLPTGATGATCNSDCLYRLTSGDGPSSYNASSSCTNGEATGEATRVGGVALAGGGGAAGEIAVDSARDGGVDGDACGSDANRHPLWPRCAGALPRTPLSGESACVLPPLSFS